MTPETIAELQKEAHEIALKTGWWDCQECKQSGMRGHVLGCTETDDCENGCWSKCPTCNGTGRAPVNIPEQIALLHSELSEALEEYWSGRPVTEIWYSMYGRQVQCGPNLEHEKYMPALKPEGFGIELADFVILILSLAGGLRAPIVPVISRAIDSPPNCAKWIASMHLAVSRMWDMDELNTEQFSLLVNYCRQYCDQLGISLEACIRLKMAYNKTREYRHGKVC